MLPEPPPDPQPDTAESAELVARAAGAEEEAASVATGDWTIAAADSARHHRRRADRPVAARQEPAHHPRLRRRRRGLPTLHRQAAAHDLPLGSAALRGQPRRRAGHPGRRLKTLKSLLSFATRMGYLPFNAGAAIHGPVLLQTAALRQMFDAPL
jgi:hypothetical protein